MITWQTKAYGWEGTLERLNRERNDYQLPNQRRRAADKAHRKITDRLADSKLMSLRGRLIRASLAGDEPTIIRLTQQMRFYLHEDAETGLYE